MIAWTVVPDNGANLQGWTGDRANLIGNLHHEMKIEGNILSTDIDRMLNLDIHILIFAVNGDLHSQERRL